MKCRSIEPDVDRGVAFCRRCGRELIETKTGWYRHGKAVVMAVWR